MIGLMAPDRLIAEAATVRGYLPDFIQLGLNTGMRKGEILGLTWDRVDLTQQMAYPGNFTQGVEKGRQLWHNGCAINKL